MIQRILWGVMALIFIYVLAYLLFGTSSTAGYFSPDTLEYGAQFETRCCGTGILLSRGRFERHEPELVQLLVSKGYWQAKATFSPRWIFLFHWSQAWRDGESSFHRALFWREDFWMEWTNKNPDAASEFWPKILELLRNGKEDEATEMLQDQRWRLIMGPH